MSAVNKIKINGAVCGIEADMTELEERIEALTAENAELKKQNDELLAYIEGDG